MEVEGRPNDEFWGHQYFIGENPPTDAVIQSLPEERGERCEAKITDALGKDVRELTVAPAQARSRDSDHVLGHAR